MMDMKALIILSNIDGIYNGLPSDPTSQVITEIRKGEDISSFIQTTKSKFGRGGMSTKATIARKIADQGVDVIIANGKTDNILLKLLDTGEDVVHTHFVANVDAVSSLKKWIAYSEGFAKGEIHVNENAAKALTGEKVVSLLPVGVINIFGEFEKDDIVKIIDEKGNQLGVGKVQVDSKKSKDLIGKKNQKPLIHCDYMYLDIT
jgi:glutamate 5-kinase